MKAMECNGGWLVGDYDWNSEKAISFVLLFPTGTNMIPPADRRKTIAHPGVCVRLKRQIALGINK